MLQKSRQAVSSTLADSEGSLERGNSAALSIVVKHTRELACEPASLKKMFKDGNTRGNKTNSISYQEYLFGDTCIFHRIDFYIRITGVICHSKYFLTNFQEREKGLEFPIPETCMRVKARNISSCNMDQSLCQA